VSCPVQTLHYYIHGGPSSITADSALHSYPFHHTTTSMVDQVTLRRALCSALIPFSMPRIPWLYPPTHPQAAGTDKISHSHPPLSPSRLFLPRTHPHSHRGRDGPTLIQWKGSGSISTNQPPSAMHRLIQQGCCLSSWNGRSSLCLPFCPPSLFSLLQPLSYSISCL
jgi:hypothetical protein